MSVWLDIIGALCIVGVFGLFAALALRIIRRRPPGTLPMGIVMLVIFAVCAFVLGAMLDGA